MKRQFRFPLCALVVFATAIRAFGGVTIYVDPQNGHGDGTGPGADALARLVDAIALWSPATNTIRLADGEYKLDSCITKIFPQVNGQVYTIESISGDPETCIIDGQNAVRCFDTTCSSYYTSEVIIRGFTIRNGYVSTDASGIAFGGGVILMRGQIYDCIVENCEATSSGNSVVGGGLYVGSDAIVSNCVIRNCKAVATVPGKGAWGGGIATYNTSGGLAGIYDSVISNCVSATATTTSIETGGGGMFLAGSPARGATVVSGTAILGNVSTNTAGTSYSWGGGIYVRACTVVLTNSLIAGNVTMDKGGAYYVNNNGGSFKAYDSTVTNNVSLAGGGGFLAWNNTTSTLLLNCLIADNKALNGDVGGLAFGDHVTISNCVIRGNTCSAMGAGCALNGNDIRIVDTVFENNASTGTGASGGGALYLVKANATLGGTLVERCAFKGNSTAATTTSAGGSVFLVNANKGITNVVFRNCLMAGNSGLGLASMYQCRTSESCTRENGYGIYFENCTMTNNTVTTSVFTGETSQPSTNVLFVVNSILKDNGTSKILYDAVYNARTANRMTYCLANPDATNFPTDNPDYRNLTKGFGKECGLTLDWMAGATDIGDGSYAVLFPSLFGVNIAWGNRRDRIVGDDVDIGATEFPIEVTCIVIR